MSEPDPQTRKNIRRNTLLLTAVALAFFFAFILMGVLKSQA